MCRQDLLNAVLPDGTLDESRLLSRELLYVGRNGKAVERFSIETAHGVESFIFKPLTNVDTLGREQWFSRHLLPSVPIRYPRLLGQAGHDDADRYWTIYEDLGNLDHRFDKQTLSAAAAVIPHWHQLPLDSVPSSFAGHSPHVNDVLSIVTERLDRLAEIATGLSMPADLWSVFRRALLRLDGVFSSETTVSHGDFHPYNITLRGGELIVLDWEYVHRNSVYWDLYNLLDITSPRYRRPAMEDEWRKEALHTYVERRAAMGWVPPDDFIRGYYFYAGIYSAWILLLIDNDLRSGSFERSALTAQQRETYAVLHDCARHIASNS